MLNEGPWCRNMFPKEPIILECEDREGWSRTEGSCYFSQRYQRAYYGMCTKMEAGGWITITWAPNIGMNHSQDTSESIWALIFV